MAASRFIILLALAALAGASSGCTTGGPAISPAVGYAYPAPVQDADEALTLPETVTVLPASYGGPTPEGAQTAAVVIGVIAPPAEYGDEPRQEMAEAGGTVALASFPATSDPAANASRRQLDVLIAKYSALYEVPEGLVRRVVKRESTYNPRAYSRGNWGLMQIRHATARGMGYTGAAKGLLDPETNLKYAVKYLRGAWLVARGDADRADRLYRRGYYYDAKRMGLLDETGLGQDRRRRGT